VTIDTPGSSAAGEIAFAGFGSTWTTWVTPQGGQYFDHEIRPTPEPSTYGVMLVGALGLLLGGFRWRRARREHAAA
ncbi:MAG TPA: PEP-CTERM sorting domain-containing protein, partial [Opitutaceae bacterium]|nr:PEP-CTERM sorting domain-containing protein [Opitutaceae bacterium]